MNDSGEKNYWEAQYRGRVNSGPGSRGKLLEFKINYLNELFKKYDVKTALDFGCGDGFLASRLNCQFYLGTDISSRAIKFCKTTINRPGFFFERGHFFDYTPAVIRGKFASGLDCCMCIDTLYHILTKGVLDKTLENLFSAGARLIILYTISPERMQRWANFSAVLKNLSKSYELVDETKPRKGSAARFFVYKKCKS